MILATIEKVNNLEIEQTLGVVSAVGMYLAGSQITGGITASSDEMYDNCFDSVMNKVIAKATKLGADGIVGIDVNYVSKDSTNDMAIHINGTAVKFKATKEFSKMKKAQEKIEKKMEEGQGHQFAPSLSNVDYSMSMMPEETKSSNVFEETCNKIARGFDLSDEQLDVLIGFKYFQTPVRTLEIQKELKTFNDRMKLVNMLYELDSLGIVHKDGEYWILDDTVALKCTD